MMVPRLAIKSLLNRRLAAGLAILSIALSVFLLLGVEKLRTGIKTSFLQSISATDLVVGPRSSGVQLLLYSMFHIGSASNNVTLKSLHTLEKRPEVAWMVPISLGDSYKGFPVVATVPDYFEHIKNAGGSSLEFQSGKRFDGDFEAVIGARVAEKLGIANGDTFEISHGLGEVSFVQHDDDKFNVVGVLEYTGTPTDESVFISLGSISELHHDWHPGKRSEPEVHSDEGDEHEATQPTIATAAFIGLRSKIAVLGFQQYVNKFPREPLTAVIPGVAFSEIWKLVSRIEFVLLAISAFVAVAAIIGLVITILSSLNERRREMAILRALGAGPTIVFQLYVLESLFLAVIGIVIGAGALYLVLWLLQGDVVKITGLQIAMSAPSANEVTFVVLILVSAILGGIIPAIRAYRMSLSDGLTMRV